MDGTVKSSDSRRAPQEYFFASAQGAPQEYFLASLGAKWSFYEAIKIYKARR